MVYEMHSGFVFAIPVSTWNIGITRVLSDPSLTILKSRMMLLHFWVNGSFSNQPCMPSQEYKNHRFANIAAAWIKIDDCETYPIAMLVDASTSDMSLGPPTSLWHVPLTKCDWSVAKYGKVSNLSVPEHVLMTSCGIPGWIPEQFASMLGLP